MALVLADRVRETTVTSGTVDIALGGAVTGFQSFAVIGNNNTTYYCIAGQGTNEWEVGIGTYISSTNTLQRTTVLSNSSGTAPSKIDFLAGVKDIFVTYPASKSVDTDTAQTLSNKTIASGVINSTTIGASTPSTGAFTSLTSTSTTTLNGTTIPASKTLVDTDSSQTLTNKTLGSGTSISTDQPSVISVNSASTALRITQTGAGNALVVEDSANPDSTPFVISSSGNVLVGTTATRSVASSFQTVANGQIFNELSSDGLVGLTSVLNRNDANSLRLVFGKSRGTAPGGVTALQNGDNICTFMFAGADGTTLNSVAAQIDVSVDGTPGTNDMPGRLVFSTTADGASSPTERMRIDNRGQIGIGATPTASVSLDVAKVIGVGGTTAYGVWSRGAVTPTTTSSASYYVSTGSTSANGGVGYTVGSIAGFRAIQGSFNADSTVTNQYGFEAQSTLTGATNNFGFYSSIPSGTGRWNFYANGTADNYFAGKLGVARTNPSVELEVGDGAGTRRISIDGGSSGAGAGSALYFKNGGTIYGGIGNQSALDGSAYSNLITLTSYYGLTFNTLTTERMRIDSSGNVGIGTSSPAELLDLAASGRLFIQSTRHSENGFSSVVSFRKGRGSLSGKTIVQNGDDVGVLQFYGFDGTNYVSAAQITAQVDGTPGTNDMPGRLVFSTTADGASTPTERMRIRSDGNFGIGGSGDQAVSFWNQKAITGGTFAYGFALTATAASTVTDTAVGYSSNIGTAAASYTLGGLNHFYAQNTLGLGAGSALTSQYGFNATASLIQATNNYGFFSNIPAGTGRWNFYAGGTADNYFAGRVGVGGVAGAMQTIRAGKNITGNAFSAGIVSDGQVQSDVTNRADYFQAATSVASGTYANIYGYQAQQGTFTGTVTNQMGFSASSTLIGATNNYGFYSNIASGTGRWNFYAAGTADNYFAGNVLIGRAARDTTGAINANTQIQNLNGTAASFGLYTWNVGASSAPFFTINKSRGVAFGNRGAVVSGDTLGSIYWAGDDGTYFTRGAQITAEVDGTPGTNDMPGRLVFSTTADGSSSPGERMRINSSGNVGIGTSSPAFPLDVAGAIRGNSWIGRANTSAPTADAFIFRPADNTLGFGTANTERMRIDSSGNVQTTTGKWIGTSSGASYVPDDGVFGGTINNGGGFKITTGGAERMRIDSSGKVGIGTSTPTAILDVYNATDSYMSVRSSTAEMTFNTGPGFTGSAATSIWNKSAIPMVFGTNNNERMRLDSSGNLLVGTTSYSVAPASGLTVQTGNNASVNIGHTNSPTGFLYANFAYNSGQIGSITQSGTTSVAYNTTSDYRLKDNVQPMQGALAKVAALRPCTYTWKADGSDGQGFIAHELQAVVPDCVTGEKDAVDAEGKPIYQGVDTSFLVATLTAAIQEQQDIINSLKARLDAAGL